MTGKQKGSLKTSDDIRDLILKLHPDIKKKIKEGFRAIIKNPDAGKKLQDELSGLRSFRVGKYRIIYRIEKSKTILVLVIGPRRTIYEETLKLIKKNPPGKLTS